MVFTTEDTEDTEHLISPRLGVRYFFFNRKGPKGIAMGRKGRMIGINYHSTPRAQCMVILSLIYKNLLKLHNK
jgi:hypothetical protein